MKNIFRFQPTPFQAPFDRFRKGGSIFWKGLSIATQAAYQSSALSLVFVISGIACTILCPCFSPPLLTMGVTLFTTTLVVKILDPYHFSIVEEFKTKACTFQTKYAKLRLICCLFAIAISLISPLLGALAAGLVGVVSGLLIQDEYFSLLRKVHAKNTKNPRFNFEEKMGFV